MSYLLVYYMEKVINLNIRKLKGKFVFSGLDNILVSNSILSWCVGKFYFFERSEILENYVDVLGNSDLKYNIKNCMIKDLVGNYCVNLDFIDYFGERCLVLPFEQSNLISVGNLSEKINNYFVDFGEVLSFKSALVKGCYFSKNLK